MTGVAWRVVTASESILSLDSEEKPRRSVDIYWEYDPGTQRVDIFVEGPKNKMKVYRAQKLTDVPRKNYVEWLAGVLKEEMEAILNMALDEGIHERGFQEFQRVVVPLRTRLETIKKEIAQAESALDKFARGPRFYPQAENVSAALRDIMSAAKVALKLSAKLSEDVDDSDNELDEAADVTLRDIIGDPRKLTRLMGGTPEQRAVTASSPRFKAAMSKLTGKKRPS